MDKEEVKKFLEYMREKAIDRLKIHTEFAGISNGCCIANTKDVKTILSMLEEKDKEIQFQKDINKTELNRHKNTEKSLKGIIKKQNRIIDLMAEFLNKRSWREHQLKNDTCYCCKIEYGADDCKDCIKQYFENEAKELINK